MDPDLFQSAFGFAVLQMGLSDYQRALAFQSALWFAGASDKSEVRLEQIREFQSALWFAGASDEQDREQAPGAFAKMFQSALWFAGASDPTL